MTIWSILFMILRRMIMLIRVLIYEWIFKLKYFFREYNNVLNGSVSQYLSLRSQA